jgi:hypothetical protein
MSSAFVRLLKEYDHALGRTAIRQPADRHIRRNLRASPGPRRPTLRWVWIPALCTLGALTIWKLVPGSAREGTHSLGVGCTVVAGPEGKREYTGQCDVHLPRMSIRTGPGTSLLERGDGVAVLEGYASFDVGHLARGVRPIRIYVFAGVIEVVGTEFEVRQDEQKGSVRLLSGRIRLVLHDSRTIELRPGERYDWASRPTSHEPPALRRAGSEPPAEAQSSASEVRERPAHPGGSPAPGTPSTARAKSNAGAYGPTRVAEVVRLRSLGRYAEALAVVDGVGSAQIDPRSREVLSYERGSLLDRLGHRQAACAQWRYHAAHFFAGRYAAAIARTLQEKCDGPQGPKQETNRYDAGE